MTSQQGLVPPTRTSTLGGAGKTAPTFIDLWGSHQPARWRSYQSQHYSLPFLVHQGCSLRAGLETTSFGFPLRPTKRDGTRPTTSGKRKSSARRHSTSRPAGPFSRKRDRSRPIRPEPRLVREFTAFVAADSAGAQGQVVKSSPPIPTPSTQETISAIFEIFVLFARFS